MAYGTGEIADAMIQKNNSLQLDDVHTPEQWMEGYSWAMVLDDSGRIIWQYQLPEHLNHSYTTREVAGFSRWYLDGYPVFCHAKSYGLCVIALPPNRYLAIQCFLLSQSHDRCAAWHVSRRSYDCICYFILLSAV